MQGRYTLDELCDRFGLGEAEVVTILATVPPVATVGKRKLYGSDALSTLRAEMLRRPLQAIPRKNDVIHPNG